MSGTTRLFYCARCNIQVVICSCCDRGQIYCAGGCARLARIDSCRAAGRRYQNTFVGKINHAARQSHYRHRQKEKDKKVTHQGSDQIDDYDLLTALSVDIKSDTTHCHFCKQPVSGLLRRCFLGGLRGDLSPIDRYLSQGP